MARKNKLMHSDEFKQAIAEQYKLYKVAMIENAYYSDSFLLIPGGRCKSDRLPKLAAANFLLI